MAIMFPLLRANLRFCFAFFEKLTFLEQTILPWRNFTLTHLTYNTRLMKV